MSTACLIVGVVLATPDFTTITYVRVPSEALLLSPERLLERAVAGDPPVMTETFQGLTPSQLVSCAVRMAFLRKEKS